MPRNSSGVYSLPAGNPVIPDTLIESTWANPTMADIGQALTDSLPRNGAAPMTGPLTLSADPITGARQATTKEYVDQFLAYATGMPLGAITAYPTNTIPSGWLLCNGQAVSRTTYPDLFTTIGTIYGAGDGTTTFNVPDLRNEFIRGLGGSSVLGTKYVASLASHSHGVNIFSGTESLGHTHSFTTGGVSANATHSHLIDDPGHSHGVNTLTSGTGTASGSGVAQTAPTSTTSSQTGIGIVGANTDHTHSGTTGNTNATHQHGVVGDTANTGGTETAPQHMVMHYIIKAVDDAASGGGGNVIPATQVSFTQAGVGTVASTAQKKFQEFVSVKDFGAVGDGVTDDSAAIAAAIVYTSTLFGVTHPIGLFFPDGVYLVTQNNFIGENLSNAYAGMVDFVWKGTGRNSAVILFKPTVSGGACYDQSLTPTKHLIGFTMEQMGLQFDNSANGGNPVHFIKSVAAALHASQAFKLNNVTAKGVAGSVLFSLNGSVNEDMITCSNGRVENFKTVIYCNNAESVCHNFFAFDLIEITGDVFEYVKGGSLGVYGCILVMTGTPGVDTALIKLGGGTTSQTYYFNNVRSELRGANCRILNVPVPSENTITFESCDLFANIPNGQSWGLVVAQHHASISFRNCVLPVRGASPETGAISVFDSLSGADYANNNWSNSRIAFVNCDQEGSRVVDMPQGWMNYETLTPASANYRNFCVTYQGCGGVSDMVEYGHVYRLGRTLLPQSPGKLVFRGTTFPAGDGSSAPVVSAQDLNVLIPWNAFVTELVVMRSSMPTAATPYQIEFIDTAERDVPGSGVIFGSTTAQANNLAIHEKVTILMQLTGTPAQRTIWCRMKAGFALGSSVGTPIEGGVYAEVL